MTAQSHLKTAVTTHFGIRARALPGLSTLSCIVWFVAAAISAQFGVGLIAYVAVLVWSSYRALRRPIDGLWLVFFVLTISVISVPLEYEGNWGGDAPIEYWYWGLCIAFLGAAIFLGLGFRSKPDGDKARKTPMSKALMVFLLVILLASAYGYAHGNSVSIIVRQGSGLFFLFFFLFIGYQLRSSADQLLKAFHRTRKVLVAYGLVYLAQTIYLNLRYRQEMPEDDFLRGRNPVLFFCGLFAALSVGEWLFRRPGSPERRLWFGTVVLGLTAILSGSRAIVAAMLLTIVIFLLLRYAAHPLRFGLAIAGVVLLLVSIRPQEILFSLVQGSPVLQHVVARFVASPESDSSLMQRSSQMVAIWEVFRSRPMLGQGIGATLMWFDPYSLSMVETSFVDTGIGYLLLKTGALGTFTFLWFLATMFRKTCQDWNLTRHPLFLGILGTLGFYTAFLPFGPSFFQFFLCFWVAVLIGYVLGFNPFWKSPMKVASVSL